MNYELRITNYELLIIRLTVQESKRLFFFLLTFFFLVPKAQAQIIPDATMPVNSIVTPSGNTAPVSPGMGGRQGATFIQVIEGGTKAGGNLFHSFREFSIPTGGEAFFNNGLDVQNIFSRVTGGGISNIDGLIRANGAANLFLINPNGIIFGPNAKLSIGGSFFASTANSIQFKDGIQFSATNPQSSPLLSVNVPIGLQYGKNPGEIRLQGKGQDLLSQRDSVAESFDRSLNPLEVLPGKTLTLVGGNVIIDGGILQAPGGRVELGGLAAEGTIGLNADGSLSFPDGAARADVSIIDKAGIKVLASGGGSITITARNLDISGESLLSAGIATSKGSPESVAAEISLDITEAMTMASSRIENIVAPNAIGNSKSINIAANSLTLTGGAQLDASTYGKGNAGNVNIIVSDRISLDGEGNGFTTAALSTIAKNAGGEGGGISITTKSLSLTNGAILGTGTYAKGKAGSVSIVASDSIAIDGEGSQYPSGIFSGITKDGEGDGQGINITTKSLTLTNGAQLNASTLGKGKAGSVTIVASEKVSLDGERKDGFPTAVLSTIEKNAEGEAAGISITTKSLTLTNGAILGTGTYAKGKAGSVTIVASDSVAIDGEGSQYASGIVSGVAKDGVGDGQGINIITKSLTLTNGAQLNASTLGEGKAGSITIVASEKVSLDGEKRDGTSTAISSEVGADAIKGAAGGINITTGSLSLTGGAQLNASTYGVGKAGNVTIVASEKVSIDGETKNGIPSGAFSTVGKNASGAADGINITAGSLFVTGGARLSASTLGKGEAGEVKIVASDIVSFDGKGKKGNFSGAFSRVEENAMGKAGGIAITSESLSVFNGAQLSAGTFGSGNAGSVTINTGALLVENAGSVSASVGSQGKGDPGNLNITANNLLLNNRASLTAASKIGSGGNIKLQSTNIQLRRQSQISAVSAPGTSEGNIDINTRILVLLEASQIRTDAEAPNGGSNIRISAADSLGLAVFQSQDSTISASGGVSVEGYVQPSTSNIPQVEVVDATELVVSSCRRREGEQSQLIVTGRGGLPISPDEPIPDEAIWVDLRPRASEAKSGGVSMEGRRDALENQQLVNSTPSIVEAQGWVTNSQGEVVLVAKAATATPYNSMFTPQYCHEP